MARLKPWEFTLPGQPISWNKAYRIRKATNRYGQEFRGMRKTEEAEQFQLDAVRIIRSAKPSRWQPVGQVRVYFWLYLKKDIDCDNVMKLIHDALQEATGIDDKFFLPAVMEKHTGCGNKARVRVVVEDLG